MSFTDVFIYFIYLLTVYSRTIGSSHYVCVNYFLFNEQNFNSFSFNSIRWVGNNELQRVWKWLWHNLKYYPSHQDMWSKTFPEIKEQPQNSRCHTGHTHSKVHTQDPQTSGTTIQNLVAQDMSILGWGSKQSWSTSLYNQPPGSDLNLASGKHTPRLLTT
jgi:hypothetical protein